VKLGEHIYDQLQHFISNSDRAVRLARRIHGLTETAKLAAKNIDAETVALKELEALLVDIVGFLSGNPLRPTLALGYASFSCSVERKEKLSEAI
jgi:hypothetical protein